MPSTNSEELTPFLYQCTECFALFEPGYFGDQWREFLMCKPCCERNNRIHYYLETYQYAPRRFYRYQPWMTRAAAVSAMCDDLESDIKDYKYSLDERINMVADDLNVLEKELAEFKEKQNQKKNLKRGSDMGEESGLQSGNETKDKKTKKNEEDIDEMINGNDEAN